MRPARAADAPDRQPREAVSRQIARLPGLEVIAPLSRAAEGRSEPSRRFLLPTPGLSRPAARDRVPLATHARYGAAIAVVGSGGMRVRVHGCLVELRTGRLPFLEAVVSLNIKNTETCELARELAQLTGETMTGAITVALRERLAREKSERSAGARAERLLAIGQRCAHMLGVGPSAAQHGDLLYDERGLPR